MVGVSPSTPRSEQFHASEGNVCAGIPLGFILCLSASVSTYVALWQLYACICFTRMCPLCVSVCVCVFLQRCGSTGLVSRPEMEV